jgi:aspartate 1-decarboxylase
MLLKMLKSKLHHATVTDTKLNYPGSIAIDTFLMESVGILPYESVLIADLTNGNRVETYAVPAPPNSGEITVLGAAARRIDPKDIVIIFSFALCTPEEAKAIVPQVVALDKHNKIAKKIS